MGYEYGIVISRNTLEKLSRNDSFNDRLRNGWSEITVIDSKDVSSESFKEIKEFQKKYLAISSAEETNEEINIERNDLANSLVWICCKIIEHNSSNKKKK